MILYNSSECSVVFTKMYVRMYRFQPFAGDEGHARPKKCDGHRRQHRYFFVTVQSLCPPPPLAGAKIQFSAHCTVDRSLVSAHSPHPFALALSCLPNETSLSLRLF